MRSGLQKNSKRQGHSLPERNTFFGRVVRILTLWGGHHPQEAHLTMQFPSIFSIDVKVPFQLPPGNINLKYNFATCDNIIKVQSGERL